VKASKSRILIWTLVAVSLYLAAYGTTRSRKFLVMKEYIVKEDRMIVRTVGPGWDVRENDRGRWKNRINPIVFAAFRPMVWMENQFRGGRTPLGRAD
jgi:hypothetical protein